MTSCLRFHSAARYEPGAVYSILAPCYADILDSAFEERLREFDREVFENPDTVGVCTLITSLDGDIAGLASYDPRQGPRVGIIGHNGILPAYRQRGYGVQQIAEVLRIFRARRYDWARVSTSEHPFYQPAQRMYEACGFRECRRVEASDKGPYRIIHYEMPLAE
jgi:ribosomal protein S18 acetylase RimI-like enzyme